MKASALGIACTLLLACSDNNGGTDGGDAGMMDSPAMDSTTGDTGVEPGSADFQIVNFSDWHAQLDPLTEIDANSEAQTYGGLGVLMGYVAKERAANPNTLLLTGGDAFGASPPLSGLFDEEPAIKGLDLLKLDADTFGNHNFDFGTAKLKSIIANATYQYVSTNLSNVTTELGANIATPYTIFQVGGGTPKVKVAVLGITNPDATMLTLPSNFGTIMIQEPIAAANKAAMAARGAGADVVVALAHMGATGVDMQMNPVGPLVDLAKGLQGVDVLLGDHTDVKVNTTINGMLVTENRSKGRTYAKVQISVMQGKIVSKKADILDAQATQTAHLTGCDAAQCTCPTVSCPDMTYTCTMQGKCVKQVMQPDPAAETMLAPYRQQLAMKYDGKIGQIGTVFVRNVTGERTMEVPIGDLTADAMLDKYKVSDGAQIAFTNGGGIRASLPSSYAPMDLMMHRPSSPYNTTPPFDIVVGDVYTILPFGNTCVVRKITGQLLWQLLEKSVFSEPQTYGGFLQIAGFSYSYKLSNSPGSRVQSVMDSNNQPIPNDTSKSYTIVTNDFTNAGGDGYTMLIEQVPSPKRDVLADVLLGYIKAHTPVMTPANGRITQNP